MAEAIDRDRETPAAAPGPSPVRWLVAAHVVVLATVLFFLSVRQPGRVIVEVGRHVTARHRKGVALPVSIR